MALLKLSLAARRPLYGRLLSSIECGGGHTFPRLMAVRPLGTASGPDEQLQRRNNTLTAATDTTATADTTTTSAGSGTGVVADKPEWDPLDVSFADPQATFKSKTTWEILRAYVVYQLCSSNYIVENNIQVICLIFF